MSRLAKKIGNRIRTYRIRAGLSQEELAEKANLHRTYIGQLERGEKNATLESLGRVISALELNFEALFANLSAEPLQNEIASECYALLILLPEKEQKLVLDLLRAFAAYYPN